METLFIGLIVLAIILLAFYGGVYMALQHPETKPVTFGVEAGNLIKQKTGISLPFKGQEHFNEPSFNDVGSATVAATKDIPVDSVKTDNISRRHGRQTCSGEDISTDWDEVIKNESIDAKAIDAAQAAYVDRLKKAGGFGRARFDLTDVDDPMVPYTGFARMGANGGQWNIKGTTQAMGAGWQQPTGSIASNENDEYMPDS